MEAEPPPPNSPLAEATRRFLFGGVWSRPGLTRVERRWVTLTCVAAADTPGPIEAHVYAALATQDIELPAMLEFVLHFAVYCGWPKASFLEMVIAQQWARRQQEQGLDPTPWPILDDQSLGPNDWSDRLERGRKEFLDVNLLPAPAGDTPYRHAGILNFVFGHVWQRPGLTRKERRVITVACVALDDAATPLRAHVTSALHSGDISKSEMDEIVLHFSAYYGFAKGEELAKVAEEAWAGRPQA